MIPRFLSWPLYGFSRNVGGLPRAATISSVRRTRSSEVPRSLFWASGACAGVVSAWRRSPDHINVADTGVVPCGYVTAVGGVCARVEVDGDDFPAQSGKGSADAARAAEELKDPWHLSFACDLLLGPIRALRQRRVLQLVLLDRHHEQRQCLAQASGRLSRYVLVLSQPLKA